MSANLPDFGRAKYIERGQVSASAGSMGPSSDWADEEPSLESFGHALIFGLVAAIVGSLLYAGFTIATHFRIGIVAAAVGYMVGWAMMQATGGKGGTRFQVAAVALTYFSVAMAEMPELLYGLHRRGMDLSHISGTRLTALAGFSLISPFLELAGGVGGIIGLAILFYGMRAAWRLTAGRR